MRRTARSQEAKRRALMQQVLVTSRAVGDMEQRLAVEIPWTPETPQYIETLTYMRERDFRRALDKVQQLVIQRLFELSKAHIVGMGEFVCSVWQLI